MPLHSPQASNAFAASGAPVDSIRTYLSTTHSTPHQALSWEPKIRENRQFHNTLTVRNLPRVFMGSTMTWTEPCRHGGGGLGAGSVPKAQNDLPLRHSYRLTCALQCC